MISFIIPTRNRPTELARTLDAIAALTGDDRDAEAIVVDNASDNPTVLPSSLANGIPVTSIRLNENHAAAARNSAAERAKSASGWLVMLDDDSHPVVAEGASITQALAGQPADVAAVAFDIRLPGAPNAQPREAGGLPEVIVGCGAAIRRETYTALGGYDPALEYYTEEYDLCARLILGGMRIAADHSIGVLHRKVTAGRDMNGILRRLVRNNGWIAARYAPEGERAAAIEDSIDRYRAIAEKESATSGYAEGLAELSRGLTSQVRTPLSRVQWDRFTGLAAAREAIAAAEADLPLRRVRTTHAGKNARCVERALTERGIDIAEDDEPAAPLVIATMSPGPMLDARDACAQEHPGRRVIAPWTYARSAATLTGSGA